VTENAAIGSSVQSRYLRSTHFSSKDHRLSAEDVLFRRKHAPTRFAERDIYAANQDLAPGGRSVLPQSDLLKSVHAYTSYFYEALALSEGLTLGGGYRLLDEKSMDETALLAFGILLEEASRSALGRRGDLVFTEGHNEDDTMDAPNKPDPERDEQGGDGNKQYKEPQRQSAGK
jgi:hypothetical protein